MSTIAPREDLTITASFRGDWNSYPTQIGRERYNTYARRSQPSGRRRDRQRKCLYRHDHSTLSLASVAGAPGNARHAVSSVPILSAFQSLAESDHEGNYSAGATLRHRIDRATFDLNWSYIYSRGVLDYTAASPSAVVYRASSPRWGTVSRGIPIG